MRAPSFSNPQLQNPAAPEQVVLGLQESEDADPYPPPEIDAAKTEEWAIILLCTDENSLIEQYNPFPKHCKIFNITIKDDFTKNKGFNKVRKICDEYLNVVIMASFPCTGGCLWNLGINQKYPHIRERVQEYRKTFRLLWKNLGTLQESWPYPYNHRMAKVMSVLEGSYGALISQTLQFG